MALTPFAFWAADDSINHIGHINSWVYASPRDNAVEVKETGNSILQLTGDKLILNSLARILENDMMVINL